MRIGITERGDAGIDMQWVGKIKYGTIDGAVLITKNITREFIKNVINCHNAGLRIVVHATCTGWGGTIMEPNVPAYKDQIDRLAALHAEGFPLENCVLRIDPIIPTDEGLRRVRDVIAYAEEKDILPAARIRISIYDEYMHVKERLNKAGFPSFYPGRDFQASIEQLKETAGVLSEYPYTFYTCAEPKLLRYTKKGQVKARGCISEEDLSIMGLKMPDGLSMNTQHRSGCLCLSCKTELLTERRQCPHKCIYCYWKENQ